MKAKVWMFLFVCIAILTACGWDRTASDSDLQPSDSGELPHQIDTDSTHFELSMKKKSWPVSTDELTYVITNDGTANVTYGTPFLLEKKVEGEWRKIPFKKGAAFTDIGLISTPGSSEERTVSLDQIDYRFTPGEYRLIKGFYTDAGKKQLAATFAMTK